MQKVARQWIYAKAMDDGGLREEHFALREQPIPDVPDNHALVRVKLVNIHANTRMQLARGAIRIGETDSGNYACAEVVKSRDDAFRDGDLIACQTGWQDYQLIRSQDEAVGHGSQASL